jgi:hypothetical protein
VKHTDTVLVVCDAQILVYFFEATTEHRVIQQLTVVITLNENLVAVQSVSNLYCFVSRQKSKVAQDVD